MSMTLKSGRPSQVTRAVTGDVRRQQRTASGLAMLGFAVVALDAQITNVALPAIHPSLGRTASGMLNTFRQMGGSLGVAVFGAIVSASAAFQAGLRISFAGTAVLVAIAVGTFALRRAARQSSPGK